ncbi:DUF1507 family protein [Longirhabdus pacifica]|uniref:DUF1507 family protein n=1 Tax=Longirhabdus pacifica TaxID=2305227 RepID=UPI001008E59A|nr:DUF1507 family protein [Longirhabdus pacifica]
MSSSEVTSLNEKALLLLNAEADKIIKLIKVQLENLSTRKCPLYEEVLDTQVYGFSRQVDFAIKAEMIEEQTGKQLINELERELAVLYEALNSKM